VSSTTLTIGGTNGTSTQSYAGSLTSGTLNIATAITTGNINIGSADASNQVNIGGVLIGANSINSTSTNLEIGNNASSIVIGPLSQTGSLNISTVVNGVRIDSNTTNENLLITQGNNKYKVTTDSYPTNVCNTALSNLAFSINTMTGDHCTAVGHNCLTRNSSGKYNIAIGADTLPNITTGGYNTAIGGLALSSATTDSNNVAIGYQALASSIESTYANIAVGYQALINYNASNGGANVAVGFQSLGALTSGIGNVAIGHRSENSNVGSSVKNTSSNYNTCIGNQATSNGNANCIVIGRNAFATANDQIILGAVSGGHSTWIQGSGGLNVTGATNIATGVGSTDSINILNGGGATTGGSVNIANGTLQTTRVNIASGTGTGIVTIGNSANTTTLASGTINLNGNSTISGSTKVGTAGTSFRCIRLGQNVGSTTSATGTITISGAPTTFGNPLIFLSVNNPGGASIWINHNVTGTGSFTYAKTYYNGTAAVGAPAETFNYIAVWL
jgi:hypothetical protein